MEELFEKGHIDENYVRVDHKELFDFVVKVFVKLGIKEEEAKIIADNLVTADMMGIESHGVQRLKRYVDGIKKGGVKINPNIRIVKEGATYALIDGDEGMGQIVGYRAMKLAIEKAKKNGVGIAVVRNSNHYGIAGYYALMAARENMIGVSLTNSRPLVAPTFGIERLLGTNPIAIAAPTNREFPFLLDMATSVVPSGKIEVYRRKNKPIPEGWVIDKDGKVSTDPNTFFSGGAILPLGGLGETHGGHKGYGLSLLVDILTGLLAGGSWSKYVGNTSEHSDVCHFFMVINIEHFGSLDDFKERITKMIEEIKSSKLHPEAERIWIHGEKGFLTEKTRKKIGVPLYKEVFEELNRIADELGVEKLKPKR